MDEKDNDVLAVLHRFQSRYAEAKQAISWEHDKAGAEYYKAGTLSSDDAFKRAFYLGMSDAYRRVLNILSDLTDLPDKSEAGDEEHLKIAFPGMRHFMQAALEHDIQEFLPGFELIGMSYNDNTITGYFVNPSDLTYVHIWQENVNILEKTAYPDSLRETMLVPVDGCDFPGDVMLTRNAGELNKMGFYIPEEVKA